MARATYKRQDEKPPAEAEELAEELEARLDDARAQKTIVEADIEEAYYFAAPWRVREASSASQTDTRSGDVDELQTSLGFEVAEDFMTMIISSFMPQDGRWAERKPDPFAPKSMQGRMAREARKQDDMIFEGVRASNFHAELAKQGVPDGAVGVFAMMITDPGRGQPMQCVGVPIRELEMNIGPDGRIDDRFIVRSVKYRHLKKQLPEVKQYPKETARKIEEEPDEEVEVVWGWWRDWDRTDDEVWKHCVTVDDDYVHHATMTGQGSCPLVIGRFNALPDFAWPQGPLLKALPDLRQIDETDAAFTENLDFTLRSPFTYPDDGVLNFEDGIEPGMGYPRRPGGTGDAIEKIWDPNPIDAAMFQHDKKERRVRRMHYVDFPEQTGKTPPSATQWLDEMIEAQKKIGTPGYAFWREFPFESFQRFRYLGEARGAVTPLEFEGVRVSLQAYNPAARAQENQEVLNAARLMQMGAAAFPQVWQAAADGLATMKNLQEKMDDKLVVFQTPESLGQSVDMIAKLGGVFGPKLGGGLTGGGQ